MYNFNSNVVCVNDFQVLFSKICLIYYNDQSDKNSIAK